MNEAVGTTRAQTRGWRTYLQVAAVLSAIDIAAHASFVNEPATVLVGAALWVAAGFFWTRRGGLGGPVTIGVLALLEIAAALFVPDEFADDGSYAGWVLPLHVVLMVVSLVTVVMTIVSERRTTGE